MDSNQNSGSRKKGNFKKTLLILVIVILTCAFVGAIFVCVELSKINEYEVQPTIAPQYEVFETEDQDISSAPVVDPSDVTWPASISPTKDDKIVNVMLIGQDRRTGESRQRSDLMIILSYNFTDKTIKLISLMRDMYVQIPGYSDNRLNAAYKFGGMELLDETIAQNFGIVIDGNFEVDFAGFTSIVDILGGIDINVSDYDAAYLNENENYNLHPGINHLNGEETLNYSRIRYVGHADYERTERQRNVINLIISKILDLGSADQLKMFDQILPYLATDMTKANILKYCLLVFQNGVDQIEKYRIPADGTFTPSVIRGMYVLIPDLNANTQLMKSYITG